MKPLTLEWIAKADADYRVSLLLHAEEEFRARDAICFHAQQAAEKYLIALLLEKELAIPKTHDLGILLGLLLPAHAWVQALVEDCAFLTHFAVNIRYPDDSACESDTKEAVAAIQRVRQRLADVLALAPLPDHS